MNFKGLLINGPPEEKNVQIFATAEFAVKEWADDMIKKYPKASVRISKYSETLLMELFGGENDKSI